MVRGDPIESFLLMIHPTRYDVPKGHLDAGESELQCALRELQEETDIAPEDVELDPHFRFATSYTVQPKKFNFEPCIKTLVIFLARLNREVDIIPSEHTGYEWRIWNPPHHVQAETIDPLLAHLAEYVKQR